MFGNICVFGKSFPEDMADKLNYLIEYSKGLASVKEKVSEDREYSIYDLDDGEYYKFEEYGYLSLTFGLPWTFCECPCLY